MQMKNRKLAAMVLSLAVLGSIGPLPSMGQATTVHKVSTAVSTPKSIDVGDLGTPIKFQGENTVKLANLQLIPGDQGQVLYVTLEVQNNTSKVLDFYPYWLKLQTKNGGKLSFSVVDPKKSSKIHPGDKQEYSYYSSVPANIQLKDLTLRLIKWDVYKSNYESPVYTFKLPQESVLPLVDEGASYTTTLNGVPVQVALKDVQLLKNQTRKAIRLHVEYTNIGYYATALPAMEYTLKGANGYLYPVKVKKAEGEKSILPKIKEKVELTVELPLEANFQDFRLLIAEPKKELKVPFAVPLASFQLQVQEEGQNLVKEEDFLFKVDGTPIRSSVTSVKVAPNTKAKSKIVTMNVSFLNEGFSPVKLPSYQYVLKGKGGYEYPSKVKQKEETLVLLPNIAEQVELTMEIPATYDIKHFVLSISEGKPDSEYTPLSSLALFDLDVDKLSLKKTAMGESIKLTLNGYDYLVTPMNLHLYPAQDSFDSYLSYELVVKNNNNVNAPMPQLGGYVTVPAKQIAPLYVKQEETKTLLPRQEVKLHMWGKIAEDTLQSGVEISLQTVEAIEGDMIGTGDIAIFGAKESDLQLGAIGLSDAHHFSNLGNLSTIKLYSVNRYEKAGSDVIVASFLVENKDKRPIKIPTYNGYFISNQGEMYPVTQKGSNSSISPGTQALITYSTLVPKSKDLRQFDLVLGIPSSKDSGVMLESKRFSVIGDSVPSTGIQTLTWNSSFAHAVNAVVFSISQIMPDIREGEENRRLKFEFNKWQMPNTTAEGEYHLTFEVKDVQGKILKTERYSLGEEGLSNGTHYLDYPLEAYYISIFEHFEGAKREIAQFYFGGYYPY